jgi:hypothetical protein
VANGRDDRGRLRCRFPLCKATIAALTGLQELDKLRTHIRRAHRQMLTLSDVLDLRARWEEPDLPGADDALADARLQRKVNPG